jgi:hypothetical protein
VVKGANILQFPYIAAKLSASLRELPFNGIIQQVFVPEFIFCISATLRYNKCNRPVADHCAGTAR